MLHCRPQTAETDVNVGGNSSIGGTNSNQTGSSTSPSSSPPSSVATLGPQAIPRRHAPADVIARQGSFRGFPALSQKTSPFKRQLSLRMNELPSTMQRKSDFPMKNTGELATSPKQLDISPQINSVLISNALLLFVIPNVCLSSPVPEVEGEGDSISSLCTQITSAFSGPTEDPFSSAPMPKPASSPQSPVAPGNIVNKPLTCCEDILSTHVSALDSPENKSVEFFASCC